MCWIVRVYALISDHAGRYLVLEEYFQGSWITKFPGGGVEPCEGLTEALQRELKEELGTSAASYQLFYVNDFYQRSYYHENARLLSVYYTVDLADVPQALGPRTKLRWLLPDFMALTFPVDRRVRRLLMERSRGVHPQTVPSSAGPSGYLPRLADDLKQHE
ncbi:MAG: NUDIX domain-containing protein [Bacteroidia bacterium]|nr:NUDIX domain-containing protein [Bacteroidia bacterium]